MQYSVKIDAFEGPLDLLLHLINRLEIDIYDIPVSEITEQYLEYIHAMQELELDVASEFLVMAATLLAIKSKTLLPKREEPLMEDFDEEYEEEDPREELMNRLIEYRKFKEAADVLKEYEQERSLVYTRPQGDLSAFISSNDTVEKISDVSIYDMLSAFKRLMERKKNKQPKKTTIHRQEIPISTRMKEILLELSEVKGRKRFEELFPFPNREHIVVTFLAVLELMKKNQILCEQEGNFKEIFVSKNEGSHT
jgi:segregation and condensation protein A